MWGHTETCGCPICRCLPRIHNLIAQGSCLPLFVEFVGGRLRVTEAEIRDELNRRGFVEGRPGPPSLGTGCAPGGAAAIPFPGAGAAPVPTPAAAQEAAEPPAKKGEEGEVSQKEVTAKPPEPVVEGNQQLFAKSKPAVPRSGAEGIPVKVEPTGEPDSVKGVTDVPALEADEKSPKVSRKPKESSKRREESEKRESKKKRRSRSRKRRDSRERRGKGGSRSPSPSPILITRAGTNLNPKGWSREQSRRGSTRGRGDRSGQRRE